MAKVKRSFGTGNVSVAITNGRQKVRASLSSVQSAKVPIGIDRDKPPQETVKGVCKNVSRMIHCPAPGAEFKPSMIAISQHTYLPQ
jgi:hypothetical protein